MAQSNAVNNIIETFYDKCMSPLRPLPRRVMKGMTSDEFEIVSATFCEEIETGTLASREQQLQVADAFARAAQRISLDHPITAYISVEKTDENTVNTLKSLNAPALADIVASARRKKGLGI